MSCNMPEVICLKQNWNHNGGWSVPSQGSHCLPFPCFAFFGEAPSMESDSWIWEEKSQVQVMRLIVRVSQAELRWVFPAGSDGKESACNAGDPGSIPRSGKSPGGMATHSSILAWRIPWTEKPGRLQPIEPHRVWTQLKWLSMHAHSNQENVVLTKRYIHRAIRPNGESRNIQKWPTEFLQRT